MIRPRQTITRRIMRPTQPFLATNPSQLDFRVPVYLMPPRDGPPGALANAGALTDIDHFDFEERRGASKSDAARSAATPLSHANAQESQVYPCAHDNIQRSQTNPFSHAAGWHFPNQRSHAVTNSHGTRRYHFAALPDATSATQLHAGPQSAAATRSLSHAKTPPKFTVPQPDPHATYPGELFHNGHGFVTGPIYSEATHPHSKDSGGDAHAEKVRRYHAEGLATAPTHESVPPPEVSAKEESSKREEAAASHRESNFETILGNPAAPVPPKEPVPSGGHQSDAKSSSEKVPAVPDDLM